MLKGQGSGPLPPLLQQYCELRDAHPEYLMLFQVGDFYETFGEDAERLARAAGLNLTHKTSKDFSTPMAGLPIRSLDNYLERLLKLGFRIAIADQAEVGDGLVNREVTQLLTPGTVVQENLLKPDANYLAALCTGDGYGLVFLDVSTGEFLGTVLYSKTAVYDELFRYRPSEVLLAPELQSQGFLEEFKQRFLVMLSQENFDDTPEPFEPMLQGLPMALKRSASAVLRYALATQNSGTLPQLRSFVSYDPSAFMQISEATLRTLEVFEPSYVGERNEAHTLLGVLGQTRTAPGRRLLRAWLRHPLVEPVPLQARLRSVENLVQDGVRRSELRKLLHRIQDLERLSSRILNNRVNARDLVALQKSLALIPEIIKLLGTPAFQAVADRLPQIHSVCEQVQTALAPNPPNKVSEGGLINAGFDPELDQLKSAAETGRAWISELEASERLATGLPLKVGYNAVFGYYLELTRSHYGAIPKTWRAVQTLKDRMRFTTPELGERERQVLQAESEALKREQVVFNELRQSLVSSAAEILQTAQILAELDVYAALAEVAVNQGYCKPEFTEALDVQAGRHPVVEQLAGFIPNDLKLHATARLVVLTGPNMAGKSTFLRQTALISLLAQIGSYVPANAARLPIFERIFTRIGASDDIAGGRSTFMVEMDELATILHQATPKSLVLLDEVGRGTSTYDGLSLAWAACEHLHTQGAFTLFATHYFELTALPDQLPAARNFHVAAKEESSGLVFYHQVLPGPANQSYGLEVARLAGLPEAVLERASLILASLEAQNDTLGQTLIDELLRLDPSRLTPVEALIALQQLRDKLQKSELTQA
jgi:DNA mismatch repair protein MutS